MVNIAVVFYLKIIKTSRVLKWHRYLSSTWNIFQKYMWHHIFKFPRHIILGDEYMMTYLCPSYGKCKAVSLQAWTGPKGG
jgi:hypothetical protein